MVQHPKLLLRHVVKVCIALLMVGVFSKAVWAAGAQRVIALAPHSVELIYALEAGDRLVATTDYADYPEAARSVPRIGGYHGIQIEKALAMNPDLVIAWDGGNKSQDIDRLESLGLRVYRSRIVSIDAVADELRTLGTLLDLTEKAEALAQGYEAELAAIRAANANKPRVRFFYQLWLDPLKTLTSESWVNEIPRSCGGENIFDRHDSSAYPQVSIEGVLIGKPDVIIVPSHHGTAKAATDHWQRWPEIPAVRNGHIHGFDGDLLHRASLRLVQGLRDVCAVFDQVRGEREHTNR